MGSQPPPDDLDLSYISDEEPTHTMTWEELVAFCGGDEIRARLYQNHQSDVVEELEIPKLEPGLRDTNVFRRSPQPVRKEG